MSLISKVLEMIESNRKKEFNCIPFDGVFPRFSDHVHGIKKATYYAITGAPGSAKTQLADFLFLYHPYEFSKTSNIEIEIVYFSFEISKELKILRGISKKLFQDHGIRLSPTLLQSIGKTKLSDDIVSDIKQTFEYFQHLEQVVTFYDTQMTPSQIFKVMQEKIRENGKEHYKEEVTIENGIKKVKKVFDFYEPYKSDKYLIFIFDHIGLILPESGQTLHQALTQFSSANVFLRNTYGVTILNIHQQSLDGSVQQFTSKGESVTTKLEPKLALLGDNRTLTRDYDVVMGMFSPHRFEVDFHRGYKAKRFEDKCRFLSILKNRDGEPDLHIGLYFDGAVNYFEELPKVQNFQIIKSGVKSDNDLLYEKYATGRVGVLDPDRSKLFNLY